MGAALSVMARSTSPEELARRIGPPSIDYDHTRDPLTERCCRTVRLATLSIAPNGHDVRTRGTWRRPIREPRDPPHVGLPAPVLPRGRHAVDVTADTMEVFRTLALARIIVPMYSFAR